MTSIVIPLFNEEESLLFLMKQLHTVLRKIDKEHEIVFIDDGSLDNSLALLKRFEKKYPGVRIFSFRKNQGKAEALSLGFEKAKGDYIVTLDADLQDRPLEIPKMLKKIEEGWDAVCGWRKNRSDSFSKVLASKLFNSLLRFLWGLNLHDYNCGLKAYRRNAAKSFHLYGGMHRFIPLLLHQQGFSITEVPVVHEKRKYGKSKYGFSKLFKDLPDMFTMLFLSRYGKRPLHFFGTFGTFLFVIGFIIFSYLSVLWFQGESIGRRPLLLFSILLMLGGLQIFFTGFLADLIINISHNGDFSKDKNSQNFLLKYSSDKN